MIFASSLCIKIHYYASIEYKYREDIRKIALRYLKINTFTKMSRNKNLNDLLVNLNPKIIRFTGEKFPSELWNNYPSKCEKGNISSK